ncbi:VOC family protein [Nocardioides dongxiaopingii]|uniref:VOC family protein n=1 Tax=Nocardioides dongxiaopingii TaxID=2576036 RepID=UPI0010C76F95|nr:VOC family protein [Nocardioides dongxiaopingii]
MTQQHHSIDYVELDCPDLAAAKAFYGAAFGWEFNDYGPGPDYVGIRRPGGEGEIGGLNPAEPRGRRGALVLLWSADLDATVASVRAAGGEIVEGPYAFPGGRRLHLLDPAGNEIGVWGA